jgi:hypothetical protein
VRDSGRDGAGFLNVRQTPHTDRVMVFGEFSTWASGLFPGRKPPQ